VWVEDASITSNYRTPYKFTGKELDKETGLYYFGARYYDARIGRWISTDPALEEYFPIAPKDKESKKYNENLPGMGGIYNVANMDVYHYGKLNPIIYIDPDGRLVGIDDMLGWAAGTLFGTRNDSFLSGVAQNFKESWIVVGGMFNTFNGAKTFGDYIKGIGELGVRLTWNLPNEIAGLLIGYAFVELGGVTEMWEDVQLVKTSILGDSAFTLGSKVVGGNEALSKEWLKKHEQGHYYQSLLLGPLYIPIIGIPSTIHYYNFMSKYERGEIKDRKDYYKFYTESWANKLGGVTP